MSAVVWCKDHVPTKSHQMHDMVNDSGLNALQFFVQNYKQADLTLTGTVRKANLMTMAAKMSGAPVQNGHQKSLPSASSPTNGSITNGANANGTADVAPSYDTVDLASNAQKPGEKVCITCGIDVSPKWWAVDETQKQELTNGHHGSIGTEAQKFVEQRKFQCHQCRKAQRTPQPLRHRPWDPTNGSEGPRPAVPEPSISTAAPALQGPAVLPPAGDYRDGRLPGHSWPRHPPPVPAAVHGAPIAVAPRPGPVSQPQPYAAPLPPRASYNDWGHRPGSQHGSPSRMMNGLPPSAPPVTGLASLRPSALPGPSPPGPGMASHQQPPPQPYMNGMPSSPRRMNGPVPPAPYVPPHYGPGASPHGLSNGVPPPPPRSDGFTHGIHQQRPPYSGVHASPPGSRNGPLPPRDGPPAAVPPLASRPQDSRPLDGRPPSGASASPSLRNLLS
jgi:hypothetical protein